MRYVCDMAAVDGGESERQGGSSFDIVVASKTYK